MVEMCSKPRSEIRATMGHNYDRFVLKMAIVAHVPDVGMRMVAAHLERRPEFACPN